MVRLFGLAVSKNIWTLEVIEGAHHQFIDNNVCLPHESVDFPPHGLLILTVCEWLIGKQLPNLPTNN